MWFVIVLALTWLACWTITAVTRALDSWVNDLRERARAKWPGWWWDW